MRWTRYLSLALRIGAPFPVAWIFLTDPGINGFFGSRFEDAVYGRAFQPYVYRTLLPWIVRALTWMLEGARGAVNELFRRSTLLGTLRVTAKVSPPRALELAVFAVVVVALLQVFVGSVRRACRQLYQGPPLLADVVAVVALCALPSLFSYNNYIYDPGTIVLSALALEALAAGLWWWFVCVVSVGFFNKETIVLFVPVFALHAYRRLSVRRYAAVVGTLVVAFAVSRVVLNGLFASQAGNYTIPQLFHHNLKLLRSYPVATVTAWLALAAAVFGDWERKPLLLKQGLLCHVPLFGACLVWGFFDELRDYYEVYPMLVLMMVPTAARAMGHDVRVGPPPPTSPAIPAT